jgi:hypothetical protein
MQSERHLVCLHEMQMKHTYVARLIYMLHEMQSGKVRVNDNMQMTFGMLHENDMQ